MGVRISVRKLTNREEWGDNIGEYFYAGRDEDWFDYTRHSDDKDFAIQVLMNNGDELDGNSGLIRPKDIDKALEWVEGHIEFKGNKRRLITALNRLKEDKNLYFTISW